MSSNNSQSYNFKEAEERWMKLWDTLGVYQWDASKSREQTFVVDTPPPTVSGSLHVGHVFSYTHTDLIVRYQRMRGKNIMYPMGWDDNGLPTERRVQNKFGIRCNARIAYDPSWSPKEKAEKDASVEEISRRNFIEACSKVTVEDEAAFERLWRQLGLSVDWSKQYATIDAHCRKISQLSFLDLVEKKLVYSSESPTMWDVDFQTALAQADLEDRPAQGAYHDIVFAIENGGEFTISTTRPELLPACIAVVAHPTDERYKKHFGSFAVTPLFRAKVPIVASEHADPEKGTGIMMVCTFGDIADVDWWKSSQLPIKQVIGKDGRLLPVDFSKPPFESKDASKAAIAYAELQGLFSKQARKKIAELLAEDGSGAGATSRALVGEPKTVEHPVKFYEKGERPIEFVTTRQWFVRILDFKKELLEQGGKISWHPEHMRHRYDHWVEGLNHDWCISRQRFFGVPFPAWYPIDEAGNIKYDSPIFATEESLPVDPLSEVPPGYKESQRDIPGGFSGDPDVMDTWATSSLTPQIASHWGLDSIRHKKLFPMDVRPQSHEIIRTWAFYTIVKAWMHEKEIPWKNVVISGWILDPDRKKMSKSKGNTITPQHLLEQYSADAVRYWAARARLGVDTAFDEKVFKNGQKLATKVFNASRFVLAQIEGFSEKKTVGTSSISHPLDRALIDELRAVIAQATSSFDAFDYANALQTAEEAFWSFCDGYVELVKARAYSGEALERSSAVETLQWALSVFLRLLAPTMPYVTEEIWQTAFREKFSEASIHKAPWPNVSEVADVKGPSHENVVELAKAILAAIHFEKSRQQKTLKWPVSQLNVVAKKEVLEAIASVRGDIEKAGRLEPNAFMVSEGSPTNGLFEVTLTLAKEMPDAQQANT